MPLTEKVRTFLQVAVVVLSMLIAVYFVLVKEQYLWGVIALLITGLTPAFDRVLHVVLTILEDSPQSDAESRVRKNLGSRLWMYVDYLSLFIFLLAVSISGLVADLVLVRIAGWIISDALSKYEIVKTFFNWLQIGTASLAVLVVFVHALFSARTQIGVERKGSP